jgi:hypothetical protein
MIAIIGKVGKGGQETLGTVMVPSNHSEARGANTWGLVIAGGLLLLTTTFICLLLFAA